jgi:hypothetical protein
MSTTPDIRKGRDLAAERVRAGLLQRDVAVHLGVSSRRVCSVEWQPHVTATMATRYLVALGKAARDAR